MEKCRILPTLMPIFVDNDRQIIQNRWNKQKIKTN